MFDAGNPKSFKAARTWVQQLEDIAGDTLLCKYLIENKVDLLPEGDVTMTGSQNSQKANTNAAGESRPEGFVSSPRNRAKEAPKCDITRLA